MAAQAKGQDGRLAGKVAIVTGAGSRADGIGNGRATSILLARHGARVMLVDQVPEWVERTSAMIAAEGGESHTMLADVTKPDDCARIVRDTVARWGRLDILVNNVGISGPPGTAVDVDLEEWDRALRVNVTSMMLMAKFAIPEMIRAGGGAIVNIASYAGLFGGHPALLYPTSKGAVVNMTRAMAAHHAADRIRV
ncbi:MAG TPA: SDR family NAD(P)-dependent oxidoreductase, partial [Acetobacteraceae bacterium]|nr:SDR family NAD(P)-dependent oxidoreductase [Acetobacteraceae bacterium]